MYKVTKTYPHELGLSACFRQHRAKSHCRFLHGYPLSFKLTFGAKELDENNWVLDFGGLKEVKAWLCETFDHRLVVANDDPARDFLVSLGQATDDRPQLAQPLIIPNVGCEAFARYVFDYVKAWLNRNGHSSRVRLLEVEVREHGGNSGIYGEGNS